MKHVANHDSLNNNKDDKNYNKEGGGMRSSSPVVMLLRRISGGPPQTGTDDGGGGVLDDDDVEDEDYGLRGGGLSLIDDKDGQVKGAMWADENGKGRTAATASVSTSVIGHGIMAGNIAC